MVLSHFSSAVGSISSVQIISFLLFSILVQKPPTAYPAIFPIPLATWSGFEIAYPNPPFSEDLIAPVDPTLDNTSFLSDLDLSWSFINQVV